MTTRTGRVVYNRKPHFFRYSDVLRVVRSVEPRGPWPPSTDVADIIQTILAAEADLLQAFADRAWKILPEQETLKMLLKTVDFIIEIVKRGPSLFTALISAAMAGFITPTEAETAREKIEEETPNGQG